MGGLFPEIPLQLLGAFASVYTAAMIFDTPKHIRVTCGSVAVCSWAVYLFVRPFSGEPTAVFLSALFIALCSQIAARRIKIPVTVVLLPSLFLLVPGIAIYRSVYYLLRAEYEAFGAYAYLTFMTAAMIGLAVFTGDFLTRFYFRVKAKCRQQWRRYKKRKEGRHDA